MRPGHWWRSRRAFLALGWAAGVGGLVWGVRKVLGRAESLAAANPTHQAFLPQVSAACQSNCQGTNTPTTEPLPSPSATQTSTPTPSTHAQPTSTPTPTATPGAVSLSGRVVHTHSASATHWQGEVDYWNHVDAAVVQAMTDQGLQTLTGASSREGAWHALLPGYQPGQIVALKVSFNNCFTCDAPGTAIDGLIEPVNALLAGLVAIGVAPADIWLCDPSRALPARFVQRCLIAGVRFFDNGCHERAIVDQADTRARLTFSPPAGVQIADQWLYNVIVLADYVINVPVMKRHALGVSLGFKNHFGCIPNPGALHPYLDASSPTYRQDYSPLVDLNQCLPIRAKTVLTVGDGLFAAPAHNASPQVWTTFGQQMPNSLFFSVDPVAVDCVMHDLIAAEMIGLTPEANRYLRLAADAGLGVFETGDPWNAGYRQIDYVKVDLSG